MSKLALAKATVWNRQVQAELRELIRQHHIEIIHVHNSLPLVSPAAYYAARAEGAAVVQTLHNYRLLCPAATLYRHGQICQKCLGRKVAWPGVLHGCYQASRATTAAVAGMLAVHGAMGTWANLVDRYIALTEFGRRKFVEGGLPETRIMVKPNFVYPDPGPGTGDGKYAIFAGRLTPEKGIQTLLKAWQALGPHLPLKIVGDGPLGPEVREAAAGNPAIQWLGRRPQAEVHALIGQAMFLVFPSEWYETFGLVAIEAFAKGTPVVASAIGALEELVDHGQTGLHFRPGDAGDLAAKVRQLLDDPSTLTPMRHNARATFQSQYTADRNYRMIRGIYEVALQSRPAMPVLEPKV